MHTKHLSAKVLPLGPAQADQATHTLIHNHEANCTLSDLSPSSTKSVHDCPGLSRCCAGRLGRVEPAGMEWLVAWQVAALASTPAVIGPCEGGPGTPSATRAHHPSGLFTRVASDQRCSWRCHFHPCGWPVDASPLTAIKVPVGAAPRRNSPHPTRDDRIRLPQFPGPI